MVTFATKSEGVADVGIGNQQIVQEGTTGFGGVLQALGNVAVTGLDVGTTVAAKSATADAVKSGEKDVVATQLEMDELAAIESSPEMVRNVKRQAELAAKGIQSGKLNRENARLLVSTHVTKAIEESPFLANKIRQAAGSLLGFNPETEVHKQFFSAFGTEAEQSAAAARANKPSKRQVGVEEIANAYRVDYQTATDLYDQGIKRSIEKERLVEDLAIGNAVAENTFGALNLIDEGESTIGIFGAMSRAHEAGEEVTASSWNQVIDAQQQASWNGMLQSFGAKRPDTQTVSRMRAEHGAKYSALKEQVKDFDSTMLREESIARLSSIHKVFGAKTLPVFTFINNTFGERTGASIMDLIRSAGGDKSRLQALLKSTPSLEPLVGMLQQDPSVFSRGLEGSLRKLDNPASTLTATDAPFIDLVSGLAAKAPPEEVESFVDKLDAKGLTNKATDLAVKAGRSAATPSTVKRMKQEWDTIQATMPQKIASIIADGVSDIIVTEQGLAEKVGTREIKGRQVDRAPNPDLTRELAKINVMLQAGGKGWARDLDMSDPRSTAQSMINTINDIANDIRLDDASTQAIRETAPRPAISGRARKEVAAPSIFSAKKFGEGMTAEQKQARIAELEAKRGK